MEFSHRRDVWTAPLVPVAVALTAGVILDHYQAIPTAFSLGAAVLALISWAAARRGQAAGLALVYLFGSFIALGAAYHHASRESYRPDDIGWVAEIDAQPARLIGAIIEEPVVTRFPADDPLQSFPRPDATVAILQVSRLRHGDDWHPASGRLRLRITGSSTGMHVGDKIDVVGRLSAPEGPANPGELDYQSFLQDQRIRAQLLVRGAGAVTVVEFAGRGSLYSLLASVRGWGHRTLSAALPAETAPVAIALLLGDGSAMSRDDWDRYIRTGVIHVLVVSGQHLVVLAAFGWFLLRILGVRRRRGAWVIALAMLAYALMTGGRPPVMRSAVMVCVLCGGILLRRPVLLANTFALAWIIVLALKPTDAFDTGCHLSFLTVAVLYWGIGRWQVRLQDPLQRLVEASQSAWERRSRAAGRCLATAYLVTALCWLAVAPLVAYRYHIVSLTGMAIGPPVVLLTSVALVAGFLLLLAAAVFWPLVPLFAWVTQVCLSGCESLVHLGDRLPLIHYASAIPMELLWVFYFGLSAFLVLEPLRRRWDLSMLAGLAWLCVGFATVGNRSTAAECRFTFLAVGHGGCTVIETPEGRTLLYDAGTMAGPDVTRRQIAPYLWHRGIRRIDEVFLSHADLDHFNGLAALSERFPIAQVTCTPSFSQRPTRAVSVTLDALRSRNIPIRIAQAGDRFTSGGLTFDVLHPPPEGPDGPENARSLVMRLRHDRHSILLTGDLEKAGLDRVLQLPSDPVDVLMAPHHGSRTANTRELAEWARPRLVVSNQGPPRGTARRDGAYRATDSIVLGTWPHGAVTLHSVADGLWVETFQSGQRFRLESRR